MVLMKLKNWSDDVTIKRIFVSLSFCNGYAQFSSKVQ